MGYYSRRVGMKIMNLLMGLMMFVVAARARGAVAAAATAAQVKTGCQEKCGNITIPYPFGTSPECYIAQNFLITCNNTHYDPPQAFLTKSNIRVLEILLPKDQLRVSGWVGFDCYNSSGSRSNYSRSWLRLGKFTISTTQNKFTAVGCDTYAVVNGSNGRNYQTGCLSLCGSRDDVIEGSCSGIGCCQTSIPKGVRAYDIALNSYRNHVQVLDFNPCSYAFVVEDGAFNFSSRDLFNLRGRRKFPVLLDWAVGNQTCDQAKKDAPNYACKENTQCHNSISGPGYGCACSDGYQGNPYLGCNDIDECSTLNPCNGTCQNLPGSFNCSCPKGYGGDGIKNGTGCMFIATRSHKLSLIIIPGTTSIILLVILLVGSWVYLGLRERKLTKRKEKFFEQNGGVLLQQLVSKYEGCAEVTQIFTAKDLEKSTNNFHESRILGQGGQGTVYKGIFRDNRVVAIKKSKMMDQSQVEQFINEVHILSQINHRNVVKLLGCCLETQVPLLVYEFVTNGTLSSHIHDPNSRSSLPWETCLRIASETAGALSYLHSSASTPIVHRDIKSTNVLLDDNFTAKVSDFGASRFVPLDQTQVATLVQGTFGYLDPEYFHSGQLTDKSDVYSFGILLLELITGKNVISPDRPEKERNLAALFHYAVEENRLLEVLDGRILNEENAQYLMEVAMLAKRCVKVQSQERPTMKEVAMELERLVKPKAKQKSVEGDWSLKENESSLNESLKTPYDCDCSSSIGYDSLTREVQLRIIESGR